MTDEFAFLPATTLAGLLHRRELGAVELLTAQLDRIERLNPAINAIVSLVPERAMQRARRLDDLAARGELAGPLHGIPMAHKDNHLTAGIRTTFGSRLRADLVPDTDDLIIERLTAAGVVAMGKTNIPEFAAGGHTFNEVFGTTRNPYDPTRTAGGSSGGAAAALAAGLHPLADGNDMGGSLRLPAGYCNVVGLRPSAGRVPVDPAADAFVGLSVQGPMARSVDDVALLLSVIAGPDRRSPLSLEEPGSSFRVVPDLLDRSGALAGLRIAVSPDLGGAVAVEDVVAESVRAIGQVAEAAGATVEQAGPDFTGADECFRTLRAWTFEATMGAELDARRDLVRPSLYENMLAGRQLTGPQVGRAAVLRTRLFHRMRRFLETFDVLILPVAPLPAFSAHVQYPDVVAGEQQPDYLGWMRTVCHVTVTGHPALALPAGFAADGTPLGVQIVGRHRGERNLLAVGKAIETLTGYGHLRPPPAAVD